MPLRGSPRRGVLYQEKTFELPLGHDVVVMGRMDQVNRIGKDEVEIVDYKTGRPRTEKEAAEDLRAWRLHALAAREVLDLRPERLVFYNVMTNEPVATARDAKALAATKTENLRNCRPDSARANSRRNPSFSCGYCDFKPLCPAHEQLISIQPAEKVAVKN